MQMTTNTERKRCIGAPTAANQPAVYVRIQPVSPCRYGRRYDFFKVWHRGSSGGGLYHLCHPVENIANLGLRDDQGRAERDGVAGDTDHHILIVEGGRERLVAAHRWPVRPRLPFHPAPPAPGGPA